DGRLASEAGIWTIALAVPLAVVTVVAAAWPHGIAGLVTAEHAARPYAAQLLPWVIASSAAQVLGGLVASALAALDDYVAAASVAGLVVTVALIGHGLIAFGWGLGVNGAVSLLWPLAVLVRRHGLGAP